MVTQRCVPTTWDDAINSWLQYLGAQGVSRQTMKLRRYHLRRLARHVDVPDPWAVTEDDLAAWLAAQSWGRETRRSTASSYRSFWRWGTRTRRTENDPTSVIGRLKPQPPMPHPAPEVAYAAALVAAEPRERLMLRLAAELGLRRGEVARVHARDVLGSRGDYRLLVHGKGDRDRVVPMLDGLALAVRDHAQGGWLFPGRIDGHLSAHYVGRRVSALLPEGVSMHSLRHRFASTAHRASRDIVLVQKLLGHASLDTTLRYVLTPDDDLRAVVEAVAGSSSGRARLAA